MLGAMQMQGTGGVVFNRGVMEHEVLQIQGR